MLPIIAPTSWHFASKQSMILLRQVFAIVSEIDPSFRFSVFTIGVSQLAHKMCFISSFRPRLSQVRTD